MRVRRLLVAHALPLGHGATTRTLAGVRWLIEYIDGTRGFFPPGQKMLTLLARKTVAAAARRRMQFGPGQSFL